MMPRRTNLHTHTTYCDGKNTAREMAQAAYDLGFHSLGFSSHATMALSEDYGMTAEGTEEYIRDVLALRSEFAGKMDIFLGVEADLYHACDLSRFDYVIGAVHYIKYGGEYIEVDWDEAHLIRGVEKHFGGDFLAACESYYAQYAALAAMKPDIIAHFDLITKFNENNRLFDTESPRYRDVAVSALEALSPLGAPLEINTGAMFRKYRSTPYPADFLLREWKRLGGGIVINSDSHSAESLNFGFEAAAELARKCGFTTVKELTYGGFIDKKL